MKNKIHKEDDIHRDIDDILANLKKPKEKVNGKDKGNRTELNLCKLLSEHFNDTFTRSVGSGNRGWQVQLSDQAKQVFSGDICVPETFKWVLECKGGYEKDINLNVLDGGGNSRIDEFIVQVTHDAGECKRLPMICWKRNRKPWLIMLRQEDLGSVNIDKFPYRLYYRNWVMITLEEFLQKTEKSFWFKE